MLHPQVFHLHTHLRIPQRSLSPFQLMFPATLPVEIPHVSQKPSYLPLNQRDLTQLQLLIQVPLPVDIPQAYHIRYHMTYHLEDPISAPPSAPSDSPSGDPLCFTTEIPIQECTSVPTSYHRDSTSELPSNFPSSFPPYMSSEEPNYYFSRSLLPSSRSDLAPGTWHPQCIHLILYHVLFLPIPPLDTPCYQPSLQIQILLVLQLILTRSPDFLQAHPCALHNISKAQIQQRLPVLHQ